MELINAIDRAIEECIAEGVLAWFFEERKDEVRKAMELDFTWERQRELIAKSEFANGKKEGKAEGKAEGRAEGRAEGKAESITRLLEIRFGDIPQELEDEILSEKTEILSNIFESAARAKSLEEFKERYHQIKYLT
ncbi:MAG: DUF4351 domain-containing protein [Lachnospiraceae bacterium]|nr:DUF4351 domain-containing protein [Lachnospiraceae bacterium]